MIINKSPRNFWTMTVFVPVLILSPDIRLFGTRMRTTRQKIGTKTVAKAGEDVDVPQMPGHCLVYESVSADKKLQQYLRKAKTQTNNVAMRKYAKLLSFLQMQAAG